MENKSELGKKFMEVIQSNPNSLSFIVSINNEGNVVSMIESIGKPGSFETMALYFYVKKMNEMVADKITDGLINNENKKS